MKVVMSICAVAALAGWMWARGHDLDASANGHSASAPRVQDGDPSLRNAAKTETDAHAGRTERGVVEPVLYSSEEPGDLKKDGRGEERHQPEAPGRS